MRSVEGYFIESVVSVHTGKYQVCGVQKFVQIKRSKYQEDDRSGGTTVEKNSTGHLCTVSTSNTTGHYLVSRIRCMILLRSNNQKELL